MKDKINKTNAARLLDKAKVTYELIPYEVDENDLSAPHVGARGGPQVGCQSERQQEVRPYTCQGTASSHRVYPWRMLAHWDEETFSYLYSSHLSGFSLHLCERRNTWTPTENRSAGLDS